MRPGEGFGTLSRSGARALRAEHAPLLNDLQSLCDILLLVPIPGTDMTAA